MSTFEWKPFKPKLRQRGLGYKLNRRYIRLSKKLRIHDRITALGFHIGKQFARQFDIGFWFRYHLRWKLNGSVECASARCRAIYSSPLRKFTIRYNVAAAYDSDIVPHLAKRKSRRNLMKRKFYLYHI